VNVTLLHNTVTEFNTAANGFVLDGIRIEAGSVTGDASTICAVVGDSADASKKNLVSTGGNEGGGGSDIRLRIRIGASIELPGYAGSLANSASEVETFITARNTLTSVLGTSSSMQGFKNSPSGAACPLP
jgi:hypothetical protein